MLGLVLVQVAAQAHIQRPSPSTYDDDEKVVYPLRQKHLEQNNIVDAHASIMGALQNEKRGSVKQPPKDQRTLRSMRDAKGREVSEQ
jgi:hypothetical protein